eukprot:CAMPEP_0201490748 /NCGR_PEP_ID=MMETSP0151_2-20130828/27282_1 /ASSEMBLY_ACC=CAM_ASM_000257 /TAXON_ID=200890 /ORGANISM="Paramoeba atlantica, Strain 621/1 / CCAP 1560/9" /LENGTH=367 /DNA_ID=CAMNT_0047876819 /DNA_START=58 /DNA_END=1161 /DNA_ORIENTATION=-
MALRAKHFADLLLRAKRKYILGGRAYYEPLEWLWAPPEPRIDSDPATGWSDQETRVGMIGRKLGMLSDYDSWGNMIPVTLIEVLPNYVVQMKTEEKEGFNALQVGTLPMKAKKATAQLVGHCQKAGVPLCSKLMEFQVSSGSLLPVGTVLDSRHFSPGQYLDIRGLTVGKGFQGGMKRWGFSGLPASHGVSLAHRSIGSTGACQDPGKVWKGKKMPGRMGHKNRTVKNVLLYKIDPENGVFVVKGQLPGKPGTWLRIIDAKNKLHPKPPPFPTFVPPEDEDPSTLGILEGELPMPYQTRLQGAHSPSFSNETVWDVQKRLGLKALAEYRKEQELRELEGLPPDEWVGCDALERAINEYEKRKARKNV